MGPRETELLGEAIQEVKAARKAPGIREILTKNNKRRKLLKFKKFRKVPTIQK